MSDRKTVNRRRFVLISVGAVAGTMLVACGQQPAPTAAPQKPADKPAEKPAAAPTAAAPAATQPAAAQPTAAAKAEAPAAKPASFKEAPMLADLVKAGKLPPVEQRLPPEPRVVTPTNTIGKYGGTFNGSGMAPEVTNDFQLTVNQGLYRFSNDLKDMYPELGDSYEFSSDFKTCTIKLHKGIKWSDGKPFTADDIMFYFDDWQFNKDLSPALSTNWRPGGTPMKYTKVDDYTVKFEFAVPNPAFGLVHYSAPPMEAWRPKHAMQKYHLKYNPDADKDAKAAGVDNWTTRWANLNAVWHYGAQDPALPVLDPWMPVKQDSQRQYYERNPYYYKVDTQGNQLPYVDKVVVEYSANLEVMNLKAVSGDLNIAGLNLLLVNYPILKQGEKQGNYTTKLVYSELGADVALAFNMNHPDPVLKKIFNDVRFRQAMSLGIDRNEINELVFLGQGTPRAATINESASIFKKEWAENYAKYDLAQANKLLDEAGLDKKGADGIRLRPDGKPMAFALEYLPQEGPKKEVCELVVKHWAKLGIKVEAQARDRAFLLTRLNAGQHDASGWQVDRQLERASWAYGWDQKLGPGGNSAITYAKAWKDWFNSQGKTGVEPPQEAKDLFEAWANWQKTAIGTPEFKEAGTKLHDLIAKNLYVIGVIGQAPSPVIVKNNVENVFKPDSKDRIWWGASNWFWLYHRAEQWFIKS